MDKSSARKNILVLCKRFSHLFIFGGLAAKKATGAVFSSLLRGRRDEIFFPGRRRSMNLLSSSSLSTRCKKHGVILEKYLFPATSFSMGRKQQNICHTNIPESKHLFPTSIHPSIHPFFSSTCVVLPRQSGWKFTHNLLPTSLRFPRDKVAKSGEWEISPRFSLSYPSLFFFPLSSFLM